MKKLLFTLLVFTSFASLNAQNIQTLSGATTITCAQDNTLTLSSSEVNYDYYLRNNADNSVVGSAQAGTGSALSFQTGTISETTSYQVFAIGPSYALNFNGTDRIVIPHSSSLQPTTGITIDCWVNPTDITTSTYHEIYRKNNNGIGRILLGFQGNGTILSFGIHTAVDGYQELDITIVASNYNNQWVHILAYYDDATNIAKVYRNGVEIGSASRDGALTAPVSPTSAYIGGVEYYEGKVAALRIWDKALTTSDERTYAKNNFLFSDEPNLVAYYPFSENTGTQLNDVTANANNGTFSGSPTWTTGTTGSAKKIVSNVQTITFSIAPEGSQDLGYLRSVNIITLPIVPYFSDASNSVVAADFDNDGDMDMAYTVAEGGTFGWYKNDGNQNYTQYQMSINPTNTFDGHISGDDLDLDGDIDIIHAAVLDATELKWLKNDGSGNFTLDTITLTTGNTRWDVTDLDTDGDMDIISVQYYNGKTVWYENDGLQNFTEHLISTSAANPTMVKAVDMDDDGDMDAVVSSDTDNKVVWFKNDGNQSFTAINISTTNTMANSVAVTDFDCDGDIDVFIASNTGITWYQNDGSENFSAVVVSTTTPVNKIRLRDLDNDGDLDILTAYQGILWFENDNNTLFTKHVLLCCLQGTGGATVDNMDIADMDNDGDLDILTGVGRMDQPSNDVRGLVWLEMDAMITSTSPAMNEQNIAVSSNITLNFNEAISGATLTADNIVIHGDQSGKINGTFSGGGTSTIVFNPTNDFFNGEVIHVNITTGVENINGYNILGQHAFDFRVAAVPYGFAPSIYTKHIISSSGSTKANFPIDMDGDGDIDVLACEGSTLVWKENDGSQNFTNHDIGTSGVSSVVYAIDLDLDGDMDALSISNNNDNTTQWFENNGSQSFTVHLLSKIPTSYYMEGLHPADFDGDGDIDIFISFGQLGGIVLYENDGNQNFTAQTRVSDHARRGRAADMDSDGDMDIVTPIRDEANYSLVWYENNGHLNGTLHTINSVEEDRVTSAYPTDLDGDGDMDVIGGSASELTWFENDGDQNFTKHLLEVINVYNGSIDAMDMDGDLDIDFVVASGSGDLVLWYENNGSESFTKNIIGNLADCETVFAVDMDLDGQMDVLSSSRTANELVWYEFGCNTCINWTGAVSTDWSNAGNWSAAVPTSTDSVLIPSAPTNQPVVDLVPATPGECDFLSVESGATLTVAAGKALTISDNIANEGTITIVSSDNGTGSFIHNTTGIDATFQRYMNNADWTNWEDGWHFLSSPVATQAISTAFTTGEYDFYCWWELTNEWVNYKNTTSAPTWSTANVLSNSLSNPTTNFVVGKGYMAAYDEAGTKSFTGTLNIANVEITGLDVTDGGTNRSWHLLGNPFSSGLTWDDSWTTTTIGGTIQIWDEGGRSYTSILAATTGIIPATNGFMVQATADASAITIPSSKRVHGGIFYKNTSYPLIKLKAINNDNPSFQESQLLFHPESTTGYEAEYDGDFLPGYAPLFYSKIDEMPMAVNSMPDVTEATSVPFTFIKNEGVNFSIEMHEAESMELDVWLLDKKINKDHNLSLNSTYYFTAFGNDNHERFVIHFSPVGINEQDMGKDLIQIWSSNNIININNPENIAGEITVYNMFGQTVERTTLNRNVNQQIDLIVSSGYYIVNIVTSKQIINKKVYLR
ncbi:MAG: FG-GAP-like repeat-containing protein [Bacteroidota bacterium]